MLPLFVAITCPTCMARRNSIKYRCSHLAKARHLSWRSESLMGKKGGAMTRKVSPKMGRISVDIEITNYQDLANVQGGYLDPAKVRRKTIRGVIDTGATRLVLPQAVAKELGLPIKKDKIRVRYADGRRGLRSEVGAVHLRLQGRENIFSAVVEPKRDTALIGAIVMEDLDFLIDSAKLCLVPRDPDYVVSELE
jgi:clan AA aspartic protease (TIGR02281 family)